MRLKCIARPCTSSITSCGNSSALAAYRNPGICLFVFEISSSNAAAAAAAVLTQRESDMGRGPFSC